MSTLYLFSETPNFPGEVFFNGCFDPFYKVKRVSSINDFIQLLTEAKQIPAISDKIDAHSHIAILSIPPERIQGTVAQLKSTLPQVVCIALVEAKEVKEPHLTDWDCLFLERPLNEVHSRCIVAAAHKLSLSTNRLSHAHDQDGANHLFSQRFFINRLESELALSKRHNDSLTCLIFGIRFYDMYQDCYGYSFLEQLFNHLGEIFKQHIRQEDVLARLGDDEIGLLLPRSQQDGAVILAQRIIDSVALKPFHFASEAENIELCAGVFSYDAADQEQNAAVADADQLLRYARHALHHAKKADEGDVFVFNELYPIS